MSEIVQAAPGARGFNWRAFWLLTGAGVVGVLALMPAALTAQADLLKDMPIPLWVVLPLQTLQNAILIGGAVGLGLWLGRRVGLGAPVVEAWTSGGRIGGRLRRILLPSMASGVCVAAAVVALDELVFSTRMPRPPVAPAPTPLWQDLLAGLYGGITEELLMRLGLFTLFAWLFGKVSRGAGARPGARALWAANFVVAILFGLGHLPATALVIPLTPLVVARAVILNGLAGLTFGYLYWTRGLESSMLSHFSADMILMTAGHIFIS